MSDITWVKRLLWIDGLAAFSAGVLVLFLHRILSPFYGISIRVLLVIACVNLLYSSLGLSLAMRKKKPNTWVTVLIAANFTWAICCAALAYYVAPTASVFGIAHILFEGVFVAGLATLELRHRNSIIL